MQSYDRNGCYASPMGVEDGAGDGAAGGPSAPEAGDGKESSNGERPRSIPTMRDIATAAGVSQSTVSRVLNDVPTRVPIAAETRERVTLAARRSGYPAWGACAQISP